MKGEVDPMSQKEYVEAMLCRNECAVLKKKKKKQQVIALTLRVWPWKYDITIQYMIVANAANTRGSSCTLACNPESEQVTNSNVDMRIDVPADWFKSLYTNSELDLWTP